MTRYWTTSDDYSSTMEDYWDKLELVQTVECTPLSVKREQVDDCVQVELVMKRTPEDDWTMVEEVKVSDLEMEWSSAKKEIKRGEEKIQGKS